MRARRVLGSLTAAACLGAVGHGALAGAAGAQTTVVLPLIPAPALAYTTGSSTQYIWRSGLHGTPAQRLGKGEQPLISPTGSVAASRAGDAGPALTIYTGARPISLFSLRSHYATPLAFSADGRYLAVGLFSTRLHPRISDSSLAVVDLQTARAQTVGRGYPCGASFAPGGGPLRIAFGLAGSTSSCEPGRVDLFAATAGVPHVRRLTRDRRSTSPVWGKRGIIFTRLTARRNTYPTAQLWLLPAGGGARQQTHVRIGPLVSGLYPDGVSADGTRVLATFGGQDTDEAWTLDLRTHRLRRLTVHGQPVIPGGISQDGRHVLGTVGDPFGPPSGQTIVTLPFTGGSATVLVRHAGSASWNW